MQDLPAKPRNDSTLSSPERATHREWIGGRVLTLLSHYWRDDDPTPLNAAIAKDWADVLEGIPQDVIQSACIEYEKQEPKRKPTPGAIYQIARSLIPPPRSDVVRFETREEKDAYIAKMARDRIDPEKAKMADEILKKAGFKLRVRKGETE